MNKCSVPQSTFYQTFPMECFLTCILFYGIIILVHWYVLFLLGFLWYIFYHLFFTLLHYFEWLAYAYIVTFIFLLLIQRKSFSF